MNNLLVHRSHPRTQKGLTTISPDIIDDKEQTPNLCCPWRWRIPKLHIPPAVRSFYFRLRRRTLVTALNVKSSDGSDVITGHRPTTRRTYKVEPLSPISFLTDDRKILQPSIRSSQVASSSSMNHVSTSGGLSLPGAVGERGVFANVRSDSRPSVSASYSQTSQCDRSDGSGKAEAKTILVHKPGFTCQTKSGHLGYQHTEKGLDNDKADHGALSETNLREAGFANGSIHTTEDEGEDNSSKDEVKHSIINPTPSPSPCSDTESDVEILVQDNGQELNWDDVSESRPYSRMGRVNLEEKEPRTPSPFDGFPAEEEYVSIGSSKDFSKPDDIDKIETPWVRNEETAVMNDSEIDEELDYYEDNDEESSDYLDMDKVLRNCPPTEVLQNMRDMVQLSKNTTSQLEKALRRAARISCGPFPRLAGSGLTKTEVIELKCAKLLAETEEFLGDMNKNFLTFYTVLEQMDKVSAQQDSFFSSILVKRGPREWRKGHAAILRKMEKLWSRDYPKVITRKLKGSILETIYEEHEE